MLDTLMGFLNAFTPKTSILFSVCPSVLIILALRMIFFLLVTFWLKNI